MDVRGVSKVFASRTVLDDLSLRVAGGEIVALLGPNGAGKTTTLRILAGLITPTRGDGSVAGVPLSGSLQRLRARVGLLTETPGLWDRLTVRDNLLTYARLFAVARAADACGRLARPVRARRPGPAIGPGCCRRASVSGWR